jgi:hypothetical protein
MGLNHVTTAPDCLIVAKGMLLHVSYCKLRSLISEVDLTSFDQDDGFIFLWTTFKAPAVIADGMAVILCYLEHGTEYAV